MSSLHTRMLLPEILFNMLTLFDSCQNWCTCVRRYEYINVYVHQIPRFMLKWHNKFTLHPIAHLFCGIHSPWMSLASANFNWQLAFISLPFFLTLKLIIDHFNALSKINLFHCQFHWTIQSEQQCIPEVRYCWHCGCFI